MTDNPFDGLRGALGDVWDWSRAVEKASIQPMLDNLVTAVDISEMGGYSSKSNMHNYRVRGVAFPDPVHRFGRIDVWWKPDVEAWFEERDRHRPKHDESEVG